MCLDADGRLCWELPLTGKLNLNAAATEGSALWAVGEKGTVLRSQDGRWESWPGLTEEALLAVSATDAGVTVVGARGTILRWRGRWTTEAPRDPGDRYTSVWTDGRHRVVAGSQCNLAVAIEDLFDACWVPWTRFDDDPASCARRLVVGGRSLSNLYLVGERGLAFRRAVDAGWEPVDAGAHDWHSVCGEASGESWLLAGDGTLARALADGGLSESRVPSSLGPTTAMACPPDGGAWVLFADGGLSGLMRCGLGGPCTPAGTVDFSARAVAHAEPSLEYVVGDLGGVGVTDGGVLGTLSGLPGTEVRRFQRDATGALYAVGSAAFAQRREPEGWRSVVRNADPSQRFFGLAFAAPGHAFLSATHGRLYQLVDGAVDMATFAKVMSGGSAADVELADVTRFGEQLVTVGERGVIAMHPVTSPSLLWPAVRPALAGQAFLNRVAVAGNEAIAVGARGQVLRIRNDGGVTPLDVGLTADITGIVALGPSHFVLLAGGALYEAVDGGLVDLKLPTGLGGLQALDGTSLHDLWLTTATGDVLRWDGGTLDRWNVSEGTGAGTSLTAILPESGGVFVGGKDAILRLAR